MVLRNPRIGALARRCDGRARRGIARPAAPQSHPRERSRLDRRGPQGRDHAGRDRMGLAQGRDRQRGREGLRRHPRQLSTVTPEDAPTSSSARTTGPASWPPTAWSSRSTRGRQRARSSRRTPSTRSRTGQRSSAVRCPVALENIGLVVNTKLAKVPKTCAQLESSALAFKKKGSGSLGIAVQQGAAGDAYHMYPFFSGLCGYIFGQQGREPGPEGDRRREREFLKNSPMIDAWNKEGLINSKVDTAREELFLKGRPPSGSPARGTSDR